MVRGGVHVQMHFFRDDVGSCGPRAFPLKGGKRTNKYRHTLLGMKGDVSLRVCISFNTRPSVSHSPGEHPWVLVSLTHSSCSLRTRHAGQCLMVHNWF